MTTRKKNSYKAILAAIILCTLNFHWVAAQEAEEEEPKKKPMLSLRYFNFNNQQQYITTQALVRVGKVVDPIKDLNIGIYLNDAADESNLIGKVKTGPDGKAFLLFSPELQNKWNSAANHSILAVTDSVPELGVLETQTDIVKSRMRLDTASGEESKEVSLLVEMLEDSTWVPVAEAEVRIGVRRTGSSLLKIGEEESYTTDSVGAVAAEFLLDSLPGDSNGNLTLVARIDDHETIGNLETELMVPWGIPAAYNSDFGKRSLWATGDKVPFWLLGLAVGIIAGVWGTLFYLIAKFLRIRSLGFK
jgi:hypothetical protein